VNRAPTDGSRITRENRWTGNLDIPKRIRNDCAEFPITTVHSDRFRESSGCNE
jgi:hypothetical protein